MLPRLDVSREQKLESKSQPRFGCQREVTDRQHDSREVASYRREAGVWERVPNHSATFPTN